MLFLLFFCIIIGSCTTSKNPFFSKRSTHEIYSESIKQAGLAETVIGRAWLSEASKSLLQPQEATLPYRETGFFRAEKPAAFAYIFRVKRGQKLTVSVSTIPQRGFQFFTEIWRQTGNDFSLLASMDTSATELNFTVKKDEDLILRIQPELLQTVEYTIQVTAGPSLAFPVATSGKPRLISYWGADRDAGKRSHEGVDIEAAFRTPALAATEGIIGRVTNNNLGGKVVFLLDASTGNSLYYAHLDSQTVQPGQKVMPGDVLGFVGNTGNAKNTVAHLHFGIYTGNGAIDPLPFIKPENEKPKKVTASLKELNGWAHLTTDATILRGADQNSTVIKKVFKNDVVFISAATGDMYKVDLPSGETGYVKSDYISAKVLGRRNIKYPLKLLDAPDSLTATKALLKAPDSIELLGRYEDYLLLKNHEITGWVLKEKLRASGSLWNAFAF